MNIRLSVHVDIPMVNGVTATEDEIQEWVEYELGYSCEISQANPLITEEFCANHVEIL